MRKTKSLTPALRRELGEVARKRLMQSLDSVSGSSEGKPADPPELGRLLTLPLVEIDPRLSRDAHWVLVSDPALARHELWNEVCRRADALGRELRSKELPPVTRQRQGRLVNLAFFTAGVMVPLLAERNAYRRAVRLAESLRRLATDESHRHVPGAGAEGSDPRLRLLVLAPVLWSLAAYHPATRNERSDER